MVQEQRCEAMHAGSAHSVSGLARPGRLFEGIIVCAALLMSGMASAQTAPTEMQLRLSAGSGAEGGGAWGLRFSRVRDWQGVSAELSGGGSGDPLNVKLSMNLLSEESSTAEAIRLGVGLSRNADNQQRLALAFTQETDGLGWTLGAIRGLGKASVYKSVPTFTNDQVLPPQVVPGYNILSRPWRSGVFVRGLYNDDALGLRLTAGADVEWENSASRQITTSLLAEKYFGRSPLSVSFGWEHAWLPKDSPNGSATDRFSFNLRYEFTRNSASGWDTLNRRSDESSERSALRETFYLKSMDNGFFRKNK